MSKSQWIWFPGDREIWLGNDFNNRRTERGALFPPFWKQDSHWQTVEFSKEFTLLQPDTLHIFVEGIYNFMVDGKLQFGQPQTWYLEAGLHRLNIKVHHLAAPPSLYIKGESDSCPANTDSTWRVTCEDKIWIDEHGVAHGSGIYLVPGMWPGCDDPTVLPSQFELLRTVPCEPTSQREIASAEASRPTKLYDFGQETFGYILLHGASGNVSIYYGESEAEALDREHCETLDHLHIVEDEGQPYRVAASKAFRFVLVEGQVAQITMLYEYLPHDETQSGSFVCSDEELNRIWQVSAYTLDLTTREFMMDGIKRDRWTWSGDAIQSYLMNYYLRFDSEAVKRTIHQLRGKDPVTAHVNTILDYTFYWFNALGDYYHYTGDSDFVREIYPRASTLMDYALSRLTDEGLAVGQPDDWIFVDWVDFPMHKRGILCFEQVLLYRSLRTMQECAAIVGDTTRDYAFLADQLRRLTDRLFWDDEKKAYLHAIEGDTLNKQITKFPNMMAMLYGMADATRSEEILRHVMLSDNVPAITTPYMRFYELAALCQMGRQQEVLSEIKAYWGGMLREGATSFWEKYNPELSASPRGSDGIGRAHLEMYGRPYGKSLCHAWGASPLYLLGKYYLGVAPTEPGYRTYAVRPCLGGLQWMHGSVPTPFGPIEIKADTQNLTVTAPQGIGEGHVRWGDQCVTLSAGQTLTLSLQGKK
ncbi:MAG: alpha-rhamnosidase [Bacteroidales bacterium]|nr:alpha-rhamnosidase [Bacteroidales bacterium]